MKTRGKKFIEQAFKIIIIDPYICMYLKKIKFTDKIKDEPLQLIRRYSFINL